MSAPYTPVQKNSFYKVAFWTMVLAVVFFVAWAMFGKDIKGYFNKPATPNTENASNTEASNAENVPPQTQPAVVMTIGKKPTEIIQSFIADLEALVRNQPDPDRIPILVNLAGEALRWVLSEMNRPSGYGRDWDAIERRLREAAEKLGRWDPAKGLAARVKWYLENRITGRRPNVFIEHHD